LLDTVGASNYRSLSLAIAKTTRGPNATKALAPVAGHVANPDRQDAFNAVVNAFLGRF